ncbi:MAG: carboxymuconolactone decarboxylase family protein, partial [Lacipirellulaceae bacterium]
CVSAHTAIGKGVGLDETSALAARQASAAEGRSQAALEFAQKLVQARGKVTDADFNQLKTEGFSEGEIGEIVANVALNIFTNYFNHVADTEIDFPVAPELVSA